MHLNEYDRCAVVVGIDERSSKLQRDDNLLSVPASVCLDTAGIRLWTRARALSMAPTGADLALCGGTWPRRVATLVARRLALVSCIAAAKWRDGAEIVDRRRELMLLKRGTALGLSCGMSARSVEQLLRAQIRAACALQYELHQRWSRTGVAPDVSVADLERVLRPAVSETTFRLIVAVASRWCEM